MRLVFFIFIICCMNSCLLSGDEKIQNPLALSYFQKAQNEFSIGKSGFIKALIYIQKANQLEPNNPIILHESGLIKFDTKLDIKGAFSDLESSIKLSKNDNLRSTRYLNRGLCYFENGELSKACNDWSKSGQEGEYYLKKYCH